MMGGANGGACCGVKARPLLRCPGLGPWRVGWAFRVWEPQVLGHPNPAYSPPRPAQLASPTVWHSVLVPVGAPSLGHPCRLASASGFASLGPQDSSLIRQMMLCTLPPAGGSRNR